MANELSGKTIAFLVSNEGIEQAELTSPWEAVKEAGGRPVLIAKEAGEAQAFNHLDKADTFSVDQTTSQVAVEDFAGLVLPGGVANGDQVRTDPDAVEFVRGFFDSGRPVAAICHGGWVIVEADRARNRTLTSWPSLQTDIRNAGGNWVDKEVQVCEGGSNVLITSRKPDDLPAFNRELIKAFSQERSSAASRT